MKFSESNYIDMSEINLNFIYFLLDNQEVVYVGQTTCGLSRVFAHVKTKYFTTAKLLKCEVKDLDILEDFYIKKYLPKYNKQLNQKMNYTISKCLKEISEMYGHCTRLNFMKMLKVLNLKLFEFEGLNYVQKIDFDKVCDCIENNLMGEKGYEVFSVGVQSRKNY